MRDKRADASRVYLVLLTLAFAQHAPVTYKELGALTDIYQRKLGPALDAVAALCQKLGIPNLAILVVRKDSGRHGYYTAKEVASMQRAVYEFDWIKAKRTKAA